MNKDTCIFMLGMIIETKFSIKQAPVYDDKKLIQVVCLCLVNKPSIVLFVRTDARVSGLHLNFVLIGFHCVHFYMFIPNISALLSCFYDLYPCHLTPRGICLNVAD